MSASRIEELRDILPSLNVAEAASMISVGMFSKFSRQLHQVGIEDKRIDQIGAEAAQNPAYRSALDKMHKAEKETKK